MRAICAPWGVTLGAYLVAGSGSLLGISNLPGLDGGCSAPDSTSGMGAASGWRLADGMLGSSSRRVALVVHEFGAEGRKEAFGDGVVPAVALAAHARGSSRTWRGPRDSRRSRRGYRGRWCTRRTSGWAQRTADPSLAAELTKVLTGVERRSAALVTKSGRSSVARDRARASAHRPSRGTTKRHAVMRRRSDALRRNAVLFD